MDSVLYCRSSKLGSATMLGWSAPLLLGWSSPMFTSRVCDLCRVRVDVRLSHPRPSVVTVPVYRGCPAGTLWGDPVSRVRPDQIANSCCACWCVVVHRTLRRVVSVESPVLTFLGFPLAVQKLSSFERFKDLKFLSFN